MNIYQICEHYKHKYRRSLISIMICGDNRLILHFKKMDSFVNKENEYIRDTPFINNFKGYIDWDLLDIHNHQLFSFYGISILVIEKQAQLYLSGAKNKSRIRRYMSQFIHYFNKSKQGK